MTHHAFQTFIAANILAWAPLLFGADGGGCKDASRQDGGQSDAAVCISHEGEPCGGNVSSACTCAPRLACTAAADGGLPAGDVGGVCTVAEGADAETDAGATTSCVADQGEHCGGNTSHPCSCAAGLACAPEPGSQLPFGDVGGRCQLSAKEMP